MSKNLTVAYERVSHLSQNMDRQTLGLSSLRSFDRTYQDKGVSGVIPFAERPSGKRLLEDIHKGIIKEVYVWEVSRLGRDVADIHNTLQVFIRNGVQTIIHKEGIRLLNDDLTQNQSATIVLSVMAALSQIARENIKEAQMQGIQIAKVKGKYLGRRKGAVETPSAFLAKPKVKKILAMLDEDYPQSHIAKVVGCSVNTVAKAKNLKSH